MVRRALQVPSADESPESRAVAYAQRVLYLEGPDAVSMNEAIEASGVSRRTLYKRIGSRDALVRRAVEASIAGADQHLDRLEGASVPLANHLALVVTFLTDQREAWEFLLVSPKARALPFFDELIAPFRRRLETRVVELLRRGQRTGEVSSTVEPGLGAFVLLAVLRAMLDSPAFGPQASRRAQDMEQVLALALAGVRGGSPA